MNLDGQSIHLFDVQKFCIHDGPGIRTVVFVKGCSLQCLWCQNPESISPMDEIAFYPERCANCLECLKACPNGAIMKSPDRIDRTICKACGTCAGACPTEALRKIGYTSTLENVYQQVAADKHYYDASGGGLTISGGEPLLQAEGIAKLLQRCKEDNIHTLIETSGSVPWEAVETVLPFTDKFYFDLKAIDDPLHWDLAYGSSKLILENARRLAETGTDIVFRMPVIPGFNDHPENLEEITGFLQEIGKPSIRLLSYHSGGIAKAEYIGMDRQLLDIQTEDIHQSLKSVDAYFEGRGISTLNEGEDEKVIKQARKPQFTKRVMQLRKTVQNEKPAVCAQRALLITDYFKSSDPKNKPVLLQKARALAHILRHRTAAIYKDELLVGCFSSKRVGGSLFPELHGVAMLEDIAAFSDREVNPLQITMKDRLLLSSKVLPYWSTKFLAMKSFPTLKALKYVKEQLGGDRYLINESGGISHIVPDYKSLLEKGTSGFFKEAGKRLEATDDPNKKAFYQAVQTVCTGFEEMAEAYAEIADALADKETDASRKAELETIASVCRHVPGRPARTLHEAFQSVIFAQIAINQESLDNSVCPGRLDQILYPYYEADLQAGRITEEEARELVGCFTIKMSEITPVFSRRLTRFHGGMFNGQVVVVGGTDDEGNDAVNNLTYLFLDAMDTLRMRQPNYHARLHKGSPEKYIKRIASLLRDGSVAPSLMNDEVTVPMLVAKGATLQDARDYSPVGCVEPVACGKSFYSTDAALVNLALCLEWTLGTKHGGAGKVKNPEFDSIEDVIQGFTVQVEHMVGLLMKDLQAIETGNALYHPTPFTSMLLSGCMETGTDSTEGGTTYNASGIQPVGLVDIADSLAAIDRVVFQEKRMDVKTLTRALANNFKNNESERGLLLRAPKYGNDDTYADRFADIVLGIFTDAISKYTNTRGGAYHAGLYSVTAHNAFGEKTGALPSGRLAGKPLANGMSPSNGMDRKGPTAALNSAAKRNPGNFARNGVNVNLKIDNGALSGKLGIRSLENLVKGYFAGGGMQVQMNILDPSILLEARDHPGKHPWLLVRVSGYSAYFNDLSPTMKQEIIDRNLHGPK